MKEIEIESVKRWVTTTGDNKMTQPASVNAICAGCRQSVLFATKRRHYDPQRDTLAFSSECPSCTLITHFWMTATETLLDDRSDEKPALYMLPASEPRLNLSTVKELLPANTLQYCTSTQDVFQSGNFTATRVMVQSTMESLFSNFLPPGNSQSSLFKTVQDSLPSMELDEPIVKLAASLRKGEPLDLILSNPEAASAETAEALMRLVEKLISFLYVVPQEFREIERQLTELSKQRPKDRRARDIGRYEAERPRKQARR